jgi:MOSC domain-containing protein YiiM
MPRVQNLFRAPQKHFPMEELSEVRAVGDTGFEGCAHARPGRNRQVLLVDRETLEALELRPGIIRENITTDGMNVNNLQIGQQLLIGEARLEVSAACTPCDPPVSGASPGHQAGVSHDYSGVACCSM